MPLVWGAAWAQVGWREPSRRALLIGIWEVGEEEAPCVFLGPPRQLTSLA